MQRLQRRCQTSDQMGVCREHTGTIFASRQQFDARIMHVMSDCLGDAGPTSRRPGPAHLHVMSEPGTMHRTARYNRAVLQHGRGDALRHRLALAVSGVPDVPRTAVSRSDEMLRMVAGAVSGRNVIRTSWEHGISRIEIYVSVSVQLARTLEASSHRANASTRLSNPSQSSRSPPSPPPWRRPRKSSASS
jgi:hypothetical protein